MPRIEIACGSREKADAEKIGEDVYRLLRVFDFFKNVKVVISECEQEELDENGEWARSPLSIRVYAFKKTALREIGEVIQELEYGNRPIPTHFIQLSGYLSSTSGELCFQTDPMGD